MFCSCLTKDGRFVGWKPPDGASGYHRRENNQKSDLDV